MHGDRHGAVHILVLADGTVAFTCGPYHNHDRAHQTAAAITRFDPAVYTTELVSALTPDDIDLLLTNNNSDAPSDTNRDAARPPFHDRRAAADEAFLQSMAGHTPPPPPQVGGPQQLTLVFYAPTADTASQLAKALLEHGMDVHLAEDRLDADDSQPYQVQACGLIEVYRHATFDRLAARFGALYDGYDDTPNC